MPLGLVMLLLQIGCAVHAGKTGRPQFWLYIILLVPGLGMLAYLLVELVPEWLGGPHSRKAAQRLGRMVDPEKRYRALAEEAEVAPTVENRLRLAEECVSLGRFDEAIRIYRQCLTGIHADDPDLMLGLAGAEFGAGDAAAARATLERLRAANPGYQSADGHLLYARALEGAGDLAAARGEYEALVDYYPGPEAKCRYALLLRNQGEAERAGALFAEVKRSLDRAPRHVRRRYTDWHALARESARG